MSNTKYYLEYIKPIRNISDDSTTLILSADTVYQVTDTSIRYITYDWVITDPLVGSVILGPRTQDTISLTRVYATASGTTSPSIDINIYYGAVGSTTALLSSNLTVTSSEVSTNGFSTSTLTSGSWLMLKIVSVVTSPSKLTVCLWGYK